MIPPSISSFSRNVEDDMVPRMDPLRLNTVDPESLTGHPRWRSTFQRVLRTLDTITETANGPTHYVDGPMVEVRMTVWKTLKRFLHCDSHRNLVNACRMIKIVPRPHRRPSFSRPPTEASRPEHLRGGRPGVEG